MKLIFDDVFENCDSASDSKQEESSSVPIPSVADIDCIFQALENMALENEVDGAIFNLRRAGQFQLFLSAKRQESCGTRQLLISEHFKRH